MSPELQFQLVNLVVLPFWGLMILAPTWSVTRRISESLIAPAALAALYTMLVLPGLANILPVLMKPDLDVIRNELTQPQTFVIAWIHYLAFDLFVGRWIYLDAQQRGINPWLTGPCLFLTLMFGPMGFLTYLAIRTCCPDKGSSQSA